MNHKYIVTLTEEERQELRALVQKGQTQGYRIKHAQILLKLDERPENQGWTYEKIKAAYHATPHTISQIAKRFVTGGVEAALGRKEQANRHKKIDGRVEAHIIAIACALPGFVDSKNEEKTERNAGYLVVSHSGGGMLRQGTRKGIRRTPANRGMRAHWVVKGLDISEDVCHGMCP